MKMKWMILGIQVRYLALLLLLSVSPPPPTPVFLIGHSAVLRRGQLHFHGWGSPRPGRGWSQRLHVPEKSNRHSEGDCVGQRGFYLDSGHRAVTEAPAFQIYNRSLEEEFNHFEDWLNVFPLYRGQGGQDGDGEEEGSGHLVGKFKVCLEKEWSGDQEAQAGMREEDSYQGLVCPPSTPGLLPHLSWIRGNAIFGAQNLPGNPTKPAHQALGQSICRKGEHPSPQHASSKGNNTWNYRLKDLEEP